MSNTNINGIKFFSITLKNHHFTIDDKLLAFINSRLTKKERQLVNELKQLDKLINIKYSSYNIQNVNQLILKNDPVVNEFILTAIKINVIYNSYYVWVCKMIDTYGKIHF